MQNIAGKFGFPAYPPLLTGGYVLHSGVKMLEVLRKTPVSEMTENVILIDWLTVTLHDWTVAEVQSLLGLDPISFTWTEIRSFRNGYPMQTSFSNISIRWGADRAEYYSSDDLRSAEDKVRTNMGISLDLTGQGCRAFETYGHGDWYKLLSDICNSGRRFNFTRLDLAFDDHTGFLPMARMRQDLEDRNFTFRGKNTGLQWSDDIENDVQGLTLYIGSKSSPVLIRIYDKAAERGFDHSLHWIRVELRLRNERSSTCVSAILEHQDIGKVFCGVLHNYFAFRTPSDDSNRSRWAIAPYWAELLQGAEKIRLWIAPGEPYNFHRTEQWIVDQVGAAILTYKAIYGSMSVLLNDCRVRHPNLPDKYKSVISEFEKLHDLRRQAIAEKKQKLKELRLKYGFHILPYDDPAWQTDIFDIFGPDLDALSESDSSGVSGDGCC